MILLQSTCIRALSVDAAKHAQSVTVSVRSKILPVQNEEVAGRCGNTMPQFATLDTECSLSVQTVRTVGEKSGHRANSTTYSSSSSLCRQHRMHCTSGWKIGSLTSHTAGNQSSTGEPTLLRDNGFLLLSDWEGRYRHGVYEDVTLPRSVRQTSLSCNSKNAWKLGCCCP